MKVTRILAFVAISLAFVACGNNNSSKSDAVQGDIISVGEDEAYVDQQLVAEAFFAEHFSEMQAQCKEPINQYYLNDLDNDGAYEMIAFNESGSLTSVFCGGGDKLEALLANVNTDDLQFANGVVRDWNLAGGNAVLSNYVFLKESKVVARYAETSYESVVNEGEYTYETTKNGESCTHEELAQLLPAEEEEWWKVTEGTLYHATPVDILTKKCKLDEKSWGSYYLVSDPDYISGRMTLENNGAGQARITAAYEMPDCDCPNFDSGWFDYSGDTLVCKYYDESKTNYWTITVEVHGNAAKVSAVCTGEPFSLVGDAYLDGIYRK